MALNLGGWQQKAGIGLAAVVILAILAAACGYLLYPKPQPPVGIETPVAVSPPADPKPVAPVPSAVPAPTPVTAEQAEKGIMVAVMGAVRAPGNYRMAEGDRVQNLIDRAHGLAEDADISDINIAAKLIDGATLTVPEAPKQEGTKDRLVLKKRQTAAQLNPPAYTRSGWVQANTPKATEAVSNVSASTPGGGQSATAPAAPSEPGLVNLNTATQQQLEALPGLGPKLAQRIIAYREQQPFQTVDDLRQVGGFGDKRIDAIRAMVTAP